jgi:hypothetical protein
MKYYYVKTWQTFCPKCGAEGPQVTSQSGSPLAEGQEPEAAVIPYFCGDCKVPLELGEVAEVLKHRCDD